MRVTQKMMSQNAVDYMNENLQKLNTYQNQVASGKQFSRPSDNPSGAVAALNINSTLETSNAFLDTAQVTNDWMSSSSFSLQQMVDAATRAITLTQEGVSDTQGSNERQTLATEMDALFQQTVDIANTSHQGNYIFAGFKTNTIPFTMVDNNGDGLYDSVTYNGDSGVILRNISPGQSIPQNVDGNAIFPQLFSAMVNARDALNTNDSTAIQNSLTSLQAAVDQINQANTTNGARQRQVQVSIDRIQNTQTELKSLLSQKEDVNMAEAISNVTYQQTVYQTVLQVGQQAISSLNLFDMLK
jgi:flagellar hook-associated protein 3 FlgL